MAYPTLDEVALRVRTGAAAAVIVEGEDRGGDAWIYGDIWFGSRAAEVRFFPQDGWPQVVEAVRVLRQQLPAIPIFGLIDRDFTSDDELEGLEPEGIYRSRCYSVENYLLDPGCWLQTVDLVTRVRGGTPPSWRTEVEVAQQLEESYTACLPAVAFNWTVAELARTQVQPTDTPIYVAVLMDGRLGRAGEVLDEWMPGAGSGFQDRLARLHQADRDALSQLVNGKLVLDELVTRLRRAVGGPAFTVLDYLNLYLDRCPDPPPDAVNLLDKILTAAQNWPDAVP
jgi:hypothetical protein